MAEKITDKQAAVVVYRFLMWLEENNVELWSGLESRSDCFSTDEILDLWAKEQKR